MLGLQSEHWLSLTGSELPEGGEEGKIKLAFNSAGCGKTDDK